MGIRVMTQIQGLSIVSGFGGGTGHSLQGCSPTPSPLATPDFARKIPANAVVMPDRLTSVKPLSTEGSVIPGETKEDGLLRREYVLVGDTCAVEFNQTIDGPSF